MRLRRRLRLTPHSWSRTLEAFRFPWTSRALQVKGNIMAATLPYTQYAIKDKASTTLATSIGAGDTSLTVQSGTGTRFPATDFCVKVDDETIYVTTRTTDTFSGLTRAYAGSTAQGHATNALIYQSADVALIQRIYDNLAGHNHLRADVTDFAHTHGQSDVTSLTPALAAKEATAYGITMDNNATITYESGLADMTFSSGPGGGYDISAWKEIE